MCDRNRQRVGGIIGLGDFGQAEQDAHHILNLFLVGGTISRHGLFDFVGGVLEDFHACLLLREQCHAARLSHQDGG